MFLINGEPLSKKSHPEHWEWIEKKRKEIENNPKKVYHFAGFDKKAKVRDEDGNLRDSPRVRLTPVECTFSDRENNLDSYDTWSYVTSLNACKPNGDGTFKALRKTVMIGYDQVFSVPQDLELIVFLKYMSKSVDVKEVDYQKISEQNARKAIVQSQAQWYIFNPQSPISVNKTGSDRQLRNIAMAWQVTGADTEDIYSVMNNLWVAVQHKETLTGTGFESFCDELDKLSDTDKQATVIRAINTGVIEYKDYIWKLKLKGGTEQFLCGVPKERESVKDEYVIKHVLGDDFTYDMVIASVNDGTAAFVKKTRDELMADVMALDLGWKKGALNFKKSAELEEIIDKKIKPE